MSHRAKRGKPSVLSASRKQTIEKYCISVNSCNCSCSVPDVMDGDESHKNKMKRLRTRKERNQARGSGEVASNRKSHPHHHHHRNHICSKDKPQSHSCSQTSSQCQRKEPRFARLFHSAQEPSVITTNRLIGHQGLFNHEVKSIDIERLLSEQRKQGRLRQPGLQENNLDAIHPGPNSHPSSPCSSLEGHLANSLEGVLIARDSDVALHQEKASVDCQSNTHGSDITPGQRPQIPDISSENENLQPTNSPSDSLKRKSKKTKAVMSIMEKETTLTEGNQNVRPELEKVNTQLNSSTPKNQTLACKPSPDSPNQLWCNSVSAVAGRLCHSLTLPLLRSRDVLAESREVLLLALQRRHGPLFQENLLKVQRRLSFGNHTVQGPDAVPPAIESDEFFTAFQGKTFDQSCFESHIKASGKSSRKQNHTNWISPPQKYQSLNQDVEWMTSPRVEKVKDCLDELVRPSSCSRFSLGLEPSVSSPPGHYLSFSPVSKWAEVDPPMPQPWDKRFNSTRMRESADMGRVEGCSLNQATTVRLGSSGPLNRETGRHPFFRFLPGQPGGHPVDPRYRPGEHAPVEIGQCSLATSSPARYSREKDYRHSFYHFNLRPTNPFPQPYHGDMMHYPPLDLLDRGQSPPLISFNSPEQWSFPPMRLY